MRCFLFVCLFVCLTGLLLELFLVIPVFAFWKLFYTQRWCITEYALRQKPKHSNNQKLVLKISCNAFFRGSIQAWSFSFSNIFLLVVKQSLMCPQSSQHSLITEWVNSPEIIIIHDIPEKLISVLACEILPPTPPLGFFFFFFKAVSFI